VNHKKKEEEIPNDELYDDHTTSFITDLLKSYELRFLRIRRTKFKKEYLLLKNNFIMELMKANATYDR
jgi:hypothetical protein